MKDMEERIKAHYLRKTLSAEQLDAITNAKSKAWSLPTVMKYAASIVFLAALFGFYQFYSAYTYSDVLESYAWEVAKSHRKGLPADYITNSIAVLNQRMDKLDFRIALPTNQFADCELLGARYCKVDKNIAAQLRLRDEAGGMITLFIAKNRSDKDIDHRSSLDSLDVHIWNTDALMYLAVEEL